MKKNQKSKNLLKSWMKPSTHSKIFHNGNVHKRDFKRGDASKSIKEGDTVTVRADLYLKAGKAIWSTHEPSGFLFWVRSRRSMSSKKENKQKHNQQHRKDLNHFPIRAAKER